MCNAGAAWYPDPPSPTVKLLLACCRDVSTQEVQDLLGTEIDWRSFSNLVLHLGVIPTVYRALMNTPAVPEAVLNLLKDEFYINARRSLTLTNELQQIFTTFEQHGIGALAYKGPALAVAIYGSAALRQFSDLDIILRKRDLLKAKALLLSLGYKPQIQSAAAERLQLQSRKDYQLLRNGVRVELHWALSLHEFHCPLPLDDLWRNTEQVVVAGRRVPMPHPDRLLPVLCVHGAKHQWRYLQWICDVSLLIRHRNLDWTSILARAAELGNQRMVLVGVMLARTLLEAPIPEDVLRKASSDQFVGRLVAQVYRNLFMDAHSWDSALNRHMFAIHVRERRLDKVRYVLHRVWYLMLPTPEDWRAFRLPASAVSLYFVVRPIRLLFRQFDKLGRRALRLNGS